MNDISNLIKKQRQSLQNQYKEIKNNKLLDERQFICFKLEEEYAIDIKNVSEIIRPIKYQILPYTKNYIKGIFNLRGNIIPLLDLKLNLGIGESKINKENTKYIVLKIICKNKEEYIAIIIDKLTTALKTDANEITKNPNEDEIVEEIIKIDNRIISILNHKKII